MFQPARMEMVEMLVLEKDIRRVTAALGELGILHLRETIVEQAAVVRSKADAEREMSGAGQLLDDATRLCEALSIEALIEVPEDLPLLEEAKIYLSDLKTRVHGITSRMSAIEEEQKNLRQLGQEMLNFEMLDIPIERLEQFSFLHFAVGSIPEENLAAVQGEAGSKVVLMPFRTPDDQQKLIAVTDKKGRWGLESVLSKAGFKSVSPPPGEKGLPADILRDASLRTRKLEVEKQALLPDLEKIGRDERHNLLRSWNRVRIDVRVLEAEGLFAWTKATGVITGWIPVESAARFKQQVVEITAGRVVFEERSASEVAPEDVPVLLKHSRLIRPFQMLVTGFGIPRYGQLEPTLLVAISFLVMFGIMFGDIGHGGVLLLGGLAMLIFGKKDLVKDVGIILSLAGLAAMTAGFIYGECFGFATGIGPGWKPLEEVAGGGLVVRQEFLIAAIGIGVVLISIGIILNIINRLRTREYGAAIFNKYGIVGIVFYWGALCTYFVWRATQSSSTVTWFAVAFVVLPLLLILLQEPLGKLANGKKGNGKPDVHGHGQHTEENLFTRCFEAVIEVYETCAGFLANTVSFVRVGAFALAHAGLSLAIFKTIEVVEGMHVPAGGLVKILILVVGNLFVIGMEGMVVSIQCVRLEYYEFFSKFFSQTGKSYAPFDLRR